ncbi:MAG: RsmE family RNA methyltransferase [Candidatus Omnitrophica bacterium]|nr:RsmE family RNA methyltransferase [Candidatus Omnitrophota bacterium]
MNRELSSKTHRIFYPVSKKLTESVSIADPGIIHYIKDVLRLKPEDILALFDGGGHEYLCLIEKIEKSCVDVRILEKKSAPASLRPFVAVACAIPKNTKIEDIIDKLTQLGVGRIIPMITDRVIVKLNEQKKAHKFVRWQKIAVAASRQSGRMVLPVIDPARTFDEVIAESSVFSQRFIPTLEGERKNVSEIKVSPSESALFLIGPEGDFSPSEIISARKSGFIPVSLGGLVLRVDTAAIAVAGFMRFSCMDSVSTV